MATNPSTLTENVGRITAPNANYTYGSAKDDTTGTAGDGTPIKKALMNDSYGFFQAALVAAGIVPSGNAETVLESQILQALQGVVGSFSDKKQWPTVANGADADHDIVFSAGKITDSNGMIPIVTAGLTKRIDAAWAVGTNAGGLFSGSVATDTTYHLFLIVKDSDLTVDAGFDIDPAAANIPSGYTAFRRIASLYTDASSNLVQFYQQGDYFGLISRALDLDISTTSATTSTFPLSTPSGLGNLLARVSCWVYAATPVTRRVFSLREEDVAVTSDNTNLQTGFIDEGNVETLALTFDIDITAAASIRHRAQANVGGSQFFKIWTQGWVDDRG